MSYEPVKINKAALRKRVEKEVEQLKLAGRLYQFKEERRCKVCRQPELLPIIHRALSMGATITQIHKDIELYNNKLSKEDRISINSLYNHAKKHFTEDDTARVVYRRILEENARKQEIDYIDGVTNIITPEAFFETAMVRGYQTLVSESSFVDLKTGMEAATKVHQIRQEARDSQEIDDIIYKTNKIMEIIREVVPAEYWREITRRISEEENGSIDSEEVFDDVDEIEPDEDIESE